MNWIDKPAVFLLLFIDIIAILIGMVAGPLGNVELSIAASISATIISGALMLFCYFTWRKKR